ncbi:UNVERIFIED_CONTAM: hypothetical protein Sindi_1266200, partial [Sesamum indicum]
ADEHACHTYSMSSSFQTKMRISIYDKLRFLPPDLDADKHLRQAHFTSSSLPT